ncbi:MAG: hypothetical protein K9L62_16285 [Vallitaleaceae bacterium]|nr:hypothetical protein [Vallitaleaceae bacterium]
MPIIDFITNKILEYIWNSIWIWRIGTLLLLILLLFKDRIFRNKDTIDHDKRIYLESKNIMPSRALDSILEEISGEHQREENFNKIIAYVEFFKAQENKYLIRRLSKKLKITINSLDLLCKFVGIHFSYTENRSDISFFEPHKKNEPEFQIEVIEWRTEKKRLIDNLDKSYTEYMDSIKKILKI